MGLVNRLADPENLHQEAQALAEQLAQRAPLAVAAIKRAVAEGMDQPLEGALGAELSQFEAAFGSADAKEGIAAFLEKRSPKWAGS
jgi:enoyl-CoA hydratase/carnithine racemase